MAAAAPDSVSVEADGKYPWQGPIVVHTYHTTTHTHIPHMLIIHSPVDRHWVVSMSWLL